MTNLNLYKYRAVNKNTISVLENNQIYFSSPESLNDPYDCRIGIKESLEAGYRISNAVRYVVDKGGSLLNAWEQMDEDINGCGILSLSQNASNTVMWSHYADEHKGICLGFDFSYSWMCDLKQMMVGCSPVDYHGKNPFISIIEDVHKEANVNGSPPSWGDVWPRMMISGLVTKTPDWSIENEFRVIRKKPGLVEFPPEFLKEVIFGLHIPEGDRDKIEEVLNQAKYKHVQQLYVEKDVVNMKILISEKGAGGIKK